QRFRRCTHSLFQLFPAGFIQHAVPADAISQIQSDRQFLLRNIPALSCHCAASLLHYRSPFSLCLEQTWILGSVQHPVADLPSHPIWFRQVSIQQRRTNGGSETSQSRITNREGARCHVATEGFCVARVAGSGSCCPQYPQFDQVGSTGLSHFGHVGCSKVP